MSSAGRPPQPPQKHQEEPRKGDHHWSLSKTLIVGIAACLFVCAIANILYAQHHHGSSSGGASILEATAIHAAVENFKNSGVGGGATRKAKDDIRIRTNEEESDSDEDDDGDGKPLEGEEQDTDDTNLADADEGQQQHEEESEDDDDKAGQEKEDSDDVDKNDSNNDMDDNKKGKGKVDKGVDVMEDNDDVDDNNEKKEKEEEEDDDDAGVKNDAKSAKKDDLASKNAAGDIRLAKLNCSAHGGPAPDFAQEMVYWYDITSDNKVRSIIRMIAVR